jgi:hypothetical protein
MTSTLHPVQIRIQNFQSIDKLEFEVRGFTCITGKTNIGKSAIMRAISRSLLNDPVTGMVRKGAKYASVEMSSAGWGYLWEKGEKDVNRYEIDGKRYDKTGQNQLPEIEAMGFRSIRIGDDDLEPWWATQTRPMFLLDKSGPQITNFISEVSRLQVYQNAIVLAARMKRKCTDESRAKSEELGRVQERMNRLSGLESVERLESEIEDQIASLQEYAQRAMTLEQLHKDLERTAGFLRRTLPLSELRVKVNMEEVEAAVSKCVRLARKKFQMDRTAQKIIAFRALDSVKVPQLPEKEVADVRRLYSLSVRITRKRAVADRLEDLPAVPSVPELDLQRLRKLVACADRIRELGKAVEESEASIQAMEAASKKLEKKMAAIQVCPECGQKLPGADEHTHAKRKRSLSA